MPLRAVVFDLDGTLLDTVQDVGAAAGYAMECLGFEKPDEQDYPTLINFGIIRGFTRLAGEERVKELMDIYVSYYHEHCTEKTRLYPDEMETLSYLCELGLKLGVLTNKTEMTARKSIDALLPGVPFDFIWGRDGIRRLKPDPSSAEDICAFWGFTPQEIAFVGDSPETDIPFSKNAGFYTVASCWGYYPINEICQSQPDCMAFGFKQLADIISKTQ